MSGPRVGDLFSGIGGFSLGLERAGMETVAFCEVNEFCQATLKKHWPEVESHDDVRTFSADESAFDVICGGFPCQDLSKAGGRKGLSGARSGLWFEFLRIIGEARPRAVIIENVTRLRAHGLDVVLRGLAEIGYDAEWHCIPAAHFGAPDLRDRLWIIAYPQHSYTDSFGSHQAHLHVEGGLELRDEQIRVPGPLLSSLPRCGEGLGPGAGRGWDPEPRIRRVAERTPEGVERSKALGNTVKPIIPEAIGREIISALFTQQEPV